MHNPFSFFKSIKCINLISRPDRWERCEKLFDEYEIKNVDRFQAIVFEENENSNNQLRRLGCAASFYSILSKAFEEKVKNILILEDDVFFLFDKETLFLKLQRDIGGLPADWDMFYMGANIHDQHLFPLSAFSDKLSKVNSAYALHSVSFSRKGIEKFIKSFDGQEDFLNKILVQHGAIDVYFATEFLHKNNCFIGKDLLAGQTPDFSDIEKWNADYTPLMKERLEHFSNLI